MSTTLTSANMALTQSKASIPVTLSPFPSALNDLGFEVEKCTFVTVNDGGLMNSIARFVGAKGNKSFVIHKKNQSAIETQKFFNYNDSDDDDEVVGPLGKQKEQVTHTSLSLGLGVHKYNFEGTDIHIVYQSIGAPVGTSSCVKTLESFLLFTVGTDKHEAIQKFVEHVVEWDERTHENTFNIYKFNAQYSYWTKLGVKIARPLSSVILPDEVKTEFLKDLEDFLSPETFKWYKDHGIPYKRSYLLYGPPGSGKSSIIQAIAGHYKLNLCNIQPIDPNFTDDSFTEAIQNAPKNALLVLEDIDTFFGKDRQALHSRCPLTFSGLLNGLDGVAAADGQVFILTTNFIDKLDSALIRTGRVDVKYPFPKVSAEMARQMFLQFYPSDEQNALTFKDTVSQILTDKDLCMADLQQHFISHRKNTADIAAQPSQVKKEITGEQLKQITEHLTKSDDADNDDGKTKKDGDTGEKNSVSNTASSNYGNYAAMALLGVSVGLAFSMLSSRRF